MLSRSATSSRASIGPSPRTSPTLSTRDAISSRRVRSRRPSSSERARNSSPATSSRTAIPAAQATGFPPNVPPSPPASGASMTSARPVTAASGRPPPSDLPETSRSGSHAVVLDRPDRPGAADSGLHLVVDVEDAVLVAELLQAPGEVGRHDDEPALALHGLEDDAGDRLRVDVALEEVAERVDRVVGGDAAVRVGSGRAIDLGRERAEASLVGHDLARHGHREQAPPVECPVEDDDGRPARCDPRDLDGVLDRLRAGVEQNALLVGSTTGRELGEPPADIDVRLVDADHEALVEVAVDLLVHRSDGRWKAVTRVLAAQAAGEVDVAAAVDILDAGALGAGDDDRRSGDPARDVALAGRQHPFRGRALLDSHRGGFSHVLQSARDRRHRRSGNDRAQRRRLPRRVGGRRGAAGLSARRPGARGCPRPGVARARARRRGRRRQLRRLPAQPGRHARRACRGQPLRRPRRALPRDEAPARARRRVPRPQA